MKAWCEERNKNGKEIQKLVKPIIYYQSHQAALSESTGDVSIIDSMVKITKTAGKKDLHCIKKYFSENPC